MGLLSYLFPQTILKSSSVYNKKIEVREINGRKILLVNGIQQTGAYTQKLWKKGVQRWIASNMPSPKDILVFGVGGGTLIHTFHKMYPLSHIVAVDIDEEIIRIGKKYFGMTSLSNISLVCQDARVFARNYKNSYTFDLVVIDIYIGNDVPEFVTAEKFLADVKKLIRKNGSLMINYFSVYNQIDKSNSLHAILSDIFTQVNMVPVLRNTLFISR